VLFPIVSRRVLPLCAALIAGIATTVVVPRDAMAAKAAKVPIAVGSFAGPQAAKIRGKVMEVLRKSGSYEVTDAEDIKPGATTAAYANMAQAMAANAIVVGVISKRFNLTLTVYGGNGARVDALEVKGGGGSFALIKKIENELEITIADPIARAKPGGGAGAKAAPAEKPKAGKAAEKKPADEEEEPEIGESGEVEAPIEGEGDSGGDSEGDSGGDSEGDSGGDSGSTDIDAPSEHAKPGLRPFEVTAGLRGYSRDFEYTSVRPYTDTSHTELHDYSLPLGPAIIAALRFYPIALFRDDAWSHVGLTARYEFGIATGTQYSQPQPDGTQKLTNLTTSSTSWMVGLRGRLPIGPHELGMFAEYGQHSFILKGDEQSRPGQPYALVPDTNYTFIRTGMDARFYFGKVVVGAQFAPRFMQSVREIDLKGVWFPGATGSGLDFGVNGGYSVLPFLSVVAGADVLRYGFDFNGMPECPDMPTPPRRCVVAGGARDTYLSGWLGAMVHLDGNAAAE
jgi:hypothetical protein